MSTTRTAIRARRKARLDERYAAFRRKTHIAAEQRAKKAAGKGK